MQIIKRKTFSENRDKEEGWNECVVERVKIYDAIDFQIKWNSFINKRENIHIFLTFVASHNFHSLNHSRTFNVF